MLPEPYQWYDSQSPGLGEEFLRCLDAAIERIQRYPLLYPVALDSFRGALIRRFPYEIFYEPTDDYILVYSVFHCSQEPG
jgi:hypothetical protein